MSALLGAADVACAIAGVPVLAASGYLGVLTLLSRRIASPTPDMQTRFDIVVPAHNEAVNIEGTIRSLQAIEYPADRFRILVIADNCSDGTADLARAAGARVIERTNVVERGKGYALALGYETALGEKFADAVVVVDADTHVSKTLLSAFSARFVAGADAVQAEYGVRNGSESWRTRLMVIALTLFHTVRSLARERLQVSCGLRGNGMGFSASVLRRVPPRAFSIVEDVEYGIALARAGVRVEYVHEAVVDGEMPSSAEASQTQRERWEGGRLALIREHVPTLMAASRTAANRWVPLDLAADLLVPPLTSLVFIVGLGFVISTGLLLWGAVSVTAVLPWAISVATLALYVIRGMVLSGVGLSGVFDLMWAPVYAVWKVTLLFRKRQRNGEWVRTARSNEK
jgi:1,2-diacylglycerol 3-beta-glucosyltransferase